MCRRLNTGFIAAFALAVLFWACVAAGYWWLRG